MYDIKIKTIDGLSYSDDVSRDMSEGLAGITNQY
jgi:hypothetical protein